MFGWKCILYPSYYHHSLASNPMFCLAATFLWIISIELLELLSVSLVNCHSTQKMKIHNISKSFELLAYKLGHISNLRKLLTLFFSQAIKLFSISNPCVLTVMCITPSMLFVMRGCLEADRQLCFTNRPSGNKHYANHSPNESISPSPILLENKCLHLTQHGGPGTGKMQFLNTQTAQHSLAYLQGKTICCDYWWTR